LKKFINKKDELLVIDHNPNIIKALIDKKIPSLYGDFGNPEIVEKLGFINPELIISTIPDKEDNIQLLKKVREINKKTIIIVVGVSIDDALEYYERGADYVILPKLLSGERISHVISKVKKNRKGLKNKEISSLNDLHFFLYKKKR
jgi:voltage-gated potassium channel Kch